MADLFSSNIDVVKQALDIGAHIEVTDYNSSTHLQFASYKGYEAIVRLLLDRVANIEAKNMYGLTPLHAASFAGHEGIAL